MNIYSDSKIATYIHVRNYRQIIFCNISKQMEDNLYILFQFNLQLVVPFLVSVKLLSRSELIRYKNIARYSIFDN